MFGNYVLSLICTENYRYKFYLVVRGEMRAGDAVCLGAMLG